MPTVPVKKILAGLVLAAAIMPGCTQTVTQHGYVQSDLVLDQIPEGSSREQVLIALGTPSATANFGGEVFYYISQTKSRPVAFMNPSLVDQKVLAVYFDEEQIVTRLANYGLKDGKVFDFVSRTTPTGGRDFSFVSQLLGAAGRVATGGPS
jgi:outer membrane protein assembly factor BamE (lipoprotein component of BamABCDE complex)